MKWFKEKARDGKQYPEQQLYQDIENIQPAEQAEFHRHWQEFLEKLTPEERAELKKADDLREKENEWRRELDRKIRSGEATVVEGDNWQQIIVDGEVVMFVDKGRQNNEIPDDM